MKKTVSVILVSSTMGCNRLSCVNDVTAEWEGFQEILKTFPFAFTDWPRMFRFLCEVDTPWYNRSHSSWGYMP